MDFNKFLKSIDNVNVCVHHDHSYDPDDMNYRGEWSNKERHHIKVRWLTGGTGGGSCWSDGGHYGLSSEPEEELTGLDTIVNTMMPTITFMQYKMHIAPLIHTYDYTVLEYYGNSEKYRNKVVFLDELYAKLTELGAFKDQ